MGMARDTAETEYVCTECKCSVYENPCPVCGNPDVKVVA